MDGATHKKLAEENLQLAKEATRGTTDQEFYLRVAEVHSNLALVEATLATGEYVDWDEPTPRVENVELRDDRAYL